MDLLAGKTAVVTGAASGIGRALANRFVRAGMQVVLADVEREPLDRAVDELRALGGEVLGVETDVADSSQVERLASAAFATFGRVNVVCNNAGVGYAGPVSQHSLEDWRWVLGVNLWGVVHGIHAFLPHLLSHGDGHIVNTGSVAGITAHAGLAAYTTSKHAVVGLSEVLYKELPPRAQGLVSPSSSRVWLRPESANLSATDHRVSLVLSAQERSPRAQLATCRTQSRRRKSRISCALPSWSAGSTSSRTVTSRLRLANAARTSCWGATPAPPSSRTSARCAHLE